MCAFRTPFRFVSFRFVATSSSLFLVSRLLFAIATTIPQPMYIHSRRDVCWYVSTTHNRFTVRTNTIANNNVDDDDDDNHARGTVNRCNDSEVLDYDDDNNSLHPTLTIIIFFIFLFCFVCFVFFTPLFLSKSFVIMVPYNNFRRFDARYSTS